MLPEKHFVNKIGLKIVLFQEQQFCERGAPPINSIKLTEIQSNICDKIQNCQDIKPEQQALAEARAVNDEQA